MLGTSVFREFCTCLECLVSSLVFVSALTSIPEVSRKQRAYLQGCYIQKCPATLYECSNFLKIQSSQSDFTHLALSKILTTTCKSSALS